MCSVTVHLSTSQYAFATSRSAHRILIQWPVEPSRHCGSTSLYPMRQMTLCATNFKAIYRCSTSMPPFSSQQIVDYMRIRVISQSCHLNITDDLFWSEESLLESFLSKLLAPSAAQDENIKAVIADIKKMTDGSSSAQG